MEISERLKGVKYRLSLTGELYLNAALEYHARPDLDLPAELSGSGRAEGLGFALRARVAVELESATSEWYIGM